MKQIIFSIIFVTLLYSSDCDIILEKYNMDLTIKSISGWQRVINNNKIQEYTNIYLTDKQRNEIIKCIKKYIQDNKRRQL